MSLSFYSRLDLALKKSLMNLVTLEQLHIVSIEYTVMREKGQDPLLQIEILLCETGQKPKKQWGNTEDIVKIGL